MLLKGINMKKIISAASFIPFGIELKNPIKLTGLAFPSSSSPRNKPFAE